jgi:hypothetical protein
MWGLWWTKSHWGRFSPSTSVSPANHHSTDFPIIIITRSWHNRPNSDRSAEWTQMDSTLPPLYQFKKYLALQESLVRLVYLLRYPGTVTFLNSSRKSSLVVVPYISLNVANSSVILNYKSILRTIMAFAFCPPVGAFIHWH